MIPYVENVRAYLLRMVTNRCINFLKSARKTREVFQFDSHLRPVRLFIMANPDKLKHISLNER